MTEQPLYGSSRTFFNAATSDNEYSVYFNLDISAL